MACPHPSPPRSIELFEHQPGPLVTQTRERRPDGFQRLPLLEAPGKREHLIQRLATGPGPGHRERLTRRTTGEHVSVGIIHRTPIPHVARIRIKPLRLSRAAGVRIELKTDSAHPELTRRRVKTTRPGKKINNLNRAASGVYMGWILAGERGREGVSHGSRHGRRERVPDLSIGGSLPSTDAPILGMHCNIPACCTVILGVPSSGKSGPGASSPRLLPLMAADVSHALLLSGRTQVGATTTIRATHQRRPRPRRALVRPSLRAMPTAGGHGCAQRLANRRPPDIVRPWPGNSPGTRLESPIMKPLFRVLWHAEVHGIEYLPLDAIPGLSELLCDPISIEREFRTACERIQILDQDCARPNEFGEADQCMKDLAFLGIVGPCDLGGGLDPWQAAAEQVKPLVESHARLDGIHDLVRQKIHAADVPPRAVQANRLAGVLIRVDQERGVETGLFESGACPPSPAQTSTEMYRRSVTLPPTAAAVHNRLTASTFHPCSLDGCHRRIDRLVLPDSYDKPSAFAQQLIGLPITPPITFDLRRPELRVCLRNRVMDWAPVPEASVDEHSYPRAREHDVGGSADLGYGPQRNTKTEAQSVQLLTQANLRLRVAAPIGLHTAPNAFARSP